MKEKSKGLKESKKARQKSLKEKRKMKKEKKSRQAGAVHDKRNRSRPVNERAT